MQILLLRHALTASNKHHLLNGRLDEPLDPEGMKETAELAARLPKTIKKIYCSDSLRTRQTADEINQLLQVPISYHPELEERDFGKISDLTWQLAEERFGEQYSEHRDFAMQYDYRPIGGESAEDVRERVEKIFEYIKSQPTGEPVLVITHAGIVRMAVYLYKNQLIGEMPTLYMTELNI